MKMKKDFVRKSISDEAGLPTLEKAVVDIMNIIKCYDPIEQNTIVRNIISTITQMRVCDYESSSELNRKKAAEMDDFMKGNSLAGEYFKEHQERMNAPSVKAR